jgi:hypothetical protein
MQRRYHRQVSQHASRVEEVDLCSRHTHHVHKTPRVIHIWHWLESPVALRIARVST